MSLLAELKRRHVFKVGVAYIVVAWLLIQIVVVVEAPLYLPDFFDTAVIVLLAIGFPIALVIAWAFELTPEGIKHSTAAEPDEHRRRRTGQRLNFLIIAALSLAVAFLVIDNYLIDGRNNVEDTARATDEILQSPGPSTSPSSTLPNSIAILPFENLSNDVNTDFAEGVYADIFYELEKLARLTVIGRRTMKRYDDTTKSYREIGAETNAENVLELLVRFADNRVRINAELVRVAGPTDSVVWTEAYEEDYTSRSFFEIQTDIAMNIAARLVGELSPADEARLAEVLTEDSEALSYYLKALPYIDDGTTENADNCLEPITQAVTIDPGFKEAWYRKGVCHDIRGAVYPAIAQQEQPLAVAALERALALDDTYVDALLYRASALASGGDWRAAGAAYRKALDAGVPPQTRNSNLFLFAIGHLRSALAGEQSRFERDPEYAGTIGTNLRMLLHESLGNVRESDRTFQLGQGLYEPWGAGQHGRLVALMGRARQGQIDRAEVTRYFRDTYATFSPFHAELARLFEDREAVAALLRGRIGQTVSNPFNQLDIATHAAYIGEPALALEGMRNAASSFGPQLNFIWTPLFREVRQLDAFRAYVREIGMVDTWREVGWPDLCTPTSGDDFRCD